MRQRCRFSDTRTRSVEILFCGKFCTTPAPCSFPRTTRRGASRYSSVVILYNAARVVSSLILDAGAFSRYLSVGNLYNAAPFVSSTLDAERRDTLSGRNLPTLEFPLKLGPMSNTLEPPADRTPTTRMRPVATPQNAQTPARLLSRPAATTRTARTPSFLGNLSGADEKASDQASRKGQSVEVRRFPELRPWRRPAVDRLELYASSINSSSNCFKRKTDLHFPTHSSTRAASDELRHPEQIAGLRNNSPGRTRYVGLCRGDRVMVQALVRPVVSAVIRSRPPARLWKNAEIPSNGVAPAAHLDAKRTCRCTTA